jgi:hypothetical protein
MTRLPYWQAAERAQRAMATVEANVECPTCGEMIGCRVDGQDVSITDACVNRCHRESHFDRDAMEADARAQAASEREGYITHLREYDHD